MVQGEFFALNRSPSLPFILLLFQFFYKKNHCHAVARATEVRRKICPQFRTLAKNTSSSARLSECFSLN